MRLKANLLVSCVLFGVALPDISSATNGIYLIGYGAKSRSMGGVGIGYTQDALGFHMNPAGINDVDAQTLQVDADAIFFKPIRSVTLPDPRDPPNAGNPIQYKSGSNEYLIPAGGAIYKFNRKLTLGFTFVGTGGGGTRYTRLSPLGVGPYNPAGRTDVGLTTGVEYLNAQMSLGGAFKIHKQHSIGAALVGSFSRFTAYGLGVFKPFSSFPDNLSNNGHDYNWGWGAKIGWKWNPTKWLGIGAMAQSKIYHTRFDEYKGLFAQKGRMNLPAQFGAGFELKPLQNKDKLVVAFDVLRYKWSRVNAISNTIEQLENTSGFLGQKMGAGFGWKDQTVFKFGLKYEIDPKWDVMAGVNYGEAPMPNDQLLFNGVAPAVTDWHVTLGGTYNQSPNIEWSFAYVHAFTNKEKGVANSGGQFDQFFPNEDLSGPGDMELKMKQDSLQVTFSYKL